MVMAPERMLTPAEVAEIFAVDTRTIRRWIDGKLINALKLPGGHWRIESGEIERIRRDGLFARAVEPVEPAPEPEPEPAPEPKRRGRPRRATAAVA